MIIVGDNVSTVRNTSSRFVGCAMKEEGGESAVRSSQVPGDVSLGSNANIMPSTNYMFGNAPHPARYHWAIT
jgi:hypothetical protein